MSQKLDTRHIRRCFNVQGKVGEEMRIVKAVNEPAKTMWMSAMKLQILQVRSSGPFGWERKAPVAEDRSRLPAKRPFLWLDWYGWSNRWGGNQLRWWVLVRAPRQVLWGAELSEDLSWKEGGLQAVACTYRGLASNDLNRDLLSLCCNIDMTRKNHDFTRKLLSSDLKISHEDASIWSKCK
jgi:hypothetical protein